MSDEGRTPVQNQQPSFAELAAALKALQQPEASGLSKHVQTIVVAAALGIGAWLMSGLSTVQNTLAQVSVTLQNVQRTTDDMSRRVDNMATAQSDMKATQATLDQRVAALERERTATQNR